MSDEKLQNSAPDLHDENSVTLQDVIDEEQELEADADAVLGASDPKNCTYIQGHITRQALYACATCTPEDKEPAGVCLACSYQCHEDHDLYELYTKRNFRCDCGNSKLASNPCRLWPNKEPLNNDNRYNQNFRGLYCTCHRPYPDPEDTLKDEMIQCIVCEDWYHLRHLGLDPSKDKTEDFYEITCQGCMEKLDFLRHYYANCEFCCFNKKIDHASLVIHYEKVVTGSSQKTETQKRTVNRLLPEDSTPKRSSLLDVSVDSPSTSKTDAGNDETALPGSKRSLTSEEESAPKRLRTDAESANEAESQTSKDSKISEDEKSSSMGDIAKEDVTGNVNSVAHSVPNGVTGDAEVKQELSSAVTKNGDCAAVKEEGSIPLQKDELNGGEVCIYLAIKPKNESNSAEEDAKPKTCAKWPEGWRQILCGCDTCKAMYSRLECDFLRDPEDTVHAYEAKGKVNRSEVSQEEEERALRALNRMDRVRAIEAIHGYNNMKTELMEYLRNFADGKKVVTKDDILHFFSKLESKRQQH